MNRCDKWVGAFGVYDIPPAISALARAAQKHAGLPDFDTIGSFRPDFWLEPGYRVCQEWGQWADARAREAYEQQTRAREVAYAQERHYGAQT